MNRLITVTGSRIFLRDTLSGSRIGVIGIVAGAYEDSSNDRLLPKTILVNVLSWMSIRRSPKSNVWIFKK